MHEFSLKIVRPEKTVFTGKATYCHFTTSDGEMGIKARHEPFMAVLKDNSTLLYRHTDGKEESIEVVNAIVSFRNNECTIAIN